MPMLIEKKVCPIALSTTEEVILLKSGSRKKASPSSIPGRVTERIHKAMRMKNSAGIITFDARSMPFSTPEAMMKWVRATKTTVHTMGRTTLLEKFRKSVVNSSVVFPSREPLSACQMYSSVHPETTE